MNDKNQHLDALQDIKQMMERSSRFISLSGLSGIAAGSCALVGAYFAYGVVNKHEGDVSNFRTQPFISYNETYRIKDVIGSQLLLIAILTFVGAFTLSFLFTYLRSKKTNMPLWGLTAQRLMINVSVPMFVGGVFLLKLLQHGVYGLIAPGCLIFYGLALVNASKYTLKEIKYLGYCEIVLGIISLSYIGNGICFWAIGFGILHIVYGCFMWWKYERK